MTYQIRIFIFFSLVMVLGIVFFEVVSELVTLKSGSSVVRAMLLLIFDDSLMDPIIQDNAAVQKLLDVVIYD